MKNKNNKLVSPCDSVIDHSTKHNVKNHLVLGKPGSGTHITSFKESEFKKEFAPKSAKIEHYTIGQEKFVRMIY